MPPMRRTPLLAALAAATLLSTLAALIPETLLAQRGRGGRGRGGGPPPTSFFITSAGTGDGANYGGLAGADAHCAQLAEAAGLPTPDGRSWRAYLSLPATDGRPAVNARDRIGAGPWHNASGDQIAATVADLHGDIRRDSNQITKLRALDERGNQVNGFGDTPNTHDILTGSDSHGRAIAGARDTTCSGYTSHADGEGSVMVGHHDRLGAENTSWNSSHASSGCSQASLAASGGAGLLYCFAAN